MESTNPTWKRALDDLNSPVNSLAKKQKLSAEKSLIDLEKGLTFIDFSPNVPEEAKIISKQLRKLVLDQNDFMEPTFTIPRYIDSSNQLETLSSTSIPKYVDSSNQLETLSSTSIPASKPASNPASNPVSNTDSTTTTSSKSHTDVPPPFQNGNNMSSLQPLTYDLIAPPTLLKSMNASLTSSGPILTGSTSSTTNSSEAISHSVSELISETISAMNSNLPPLPPITSPSLLSAPFTHTSALPYYMPATNTNTYEPLEFLGDAYLELIATRLIHDRFPSHTVGQKANLREILIKNDNLSVYSKSYGFEDRIKVTEQEKQNRSSKAWIKILADVFEAYVACVIISDVNKGFSVCENWLRQLWEPKIQEWRTTGIGKQTGEEEQHANTDCKAILQKYVATKGVKLEYLEEKPMEHIKDGNRTTFYVGVYFTGWSYKKLYLGSGKGRSKVIAGAEAAKDAFIRSSKIIEEVHQKKLRYDQASKTAKNS